MAFFDGDLLLCRHKIVCGSQQRTAHISGADGHTFEIDYVFESSPGCPVNVTCRRDSQYEYEAGLSFGVHDSADWESIELAHHTLAFRCKVCTHH